MPRRLGSERATVRLNGEKIIQLRMNEGLTQEDWAARAGISKAYASLIENGVRKISSRMASRIASSFGVDKDTITQETQPVRTTLTSTLKFSGLETDTASRDQILEELKLAMNYTNRLIHMLETR